MTSLAVLFIGCSVVALSIGGGSALKIERINDYENELSPKSFTLRCTPIKDGYCDKKVILMEFSKNRGRVISTIRESGDITYGQGMKSSVRANGHIESDASRCHLSISIMDAVKEDSGNYTCTIIYLDSHGNRKEEQQSADIRMEGEDLQDVVRRLLIKVSLLENMMRQNDTLQKVRFVENQIVDLGMQQQTQREHINALFEDMSTLSGHSAEIQQMVDNDKYTTAFSASYNAKDTFSVGDTLVFSDTLLDIGHSYDTQTGVFTAQRDGLYVFTLAIFYYNRGNINVNLKVNDLVKASVSSGDASYYDQSAVTTVVSLQTGDIVRPEVSKFSVKRRTVVPDDHFSVFSGYLLKLL